MHPSEPQLQAFIQWLEDEQPNSPLVPAAKALAKLTLVKVRSGVGPQPFNRAQIAIQAGAQPGDPEKLCSDDHEIARRWLKAESFKALFDGWKDRQIAWLRQSDPNCSSFIDLREVGSKSGGAGNRKGYLLVSTPISMAQAAHAEDEQGAETSAECGDAPNDIVEKGTSPTSLAVVEPDWVDGEIAVATQSQPGTLHYEMSICERGELTAWGRLTFKNGILRKHSWRWTLHSGRFVFAWIVTAAIALFGVFLPLGGLIKLAPVEIVSAVVLICYFTLFELRPWHEVARDRIRVASDTWLKLGDPAQIEICRTHNDSEWRLVRYSAVCPVCASRVFVERGEPDFPRRLVGRCSESPREHVFSFDRITRRGATLVCPP